MNRDIMRRMGFGDEVKDGEDGKCPMCKKVVHPNKEFRDEISRREFDIAGMCQKCQDETFGGTS